MPSDGKGADGNDDHEPHKAATHQPGHHPSKAKWSLKRPLLAIGPYRLDFNWRLFAT